MLFAAGARVSYLLGAGVARGARSPGTSCRPRPTACSASSPSSTLGAPQRHRLPALASRCSASANGGWLGQGLGEGKGKLFYLPAAHTDFIAAVIARGGWGCSACRCSSLLFALARLARAARRAARRRAVRLLRWRSASPRSSASQALVNLAVVLGLLPTKGLTLPFVSYGGSSLMTLLAGAGVLLSVSGERGGFLRRPVRRRAPTGSAATAEGGGGDAMRLLIAGGGTGGHVFPGIALAEEVVTRHPANDVVFVGTARGLEATVVPQAGFPIELIDVQGPEGEGAPGSCSRACSCLPRAFVAVRRGSCARWRPDVVVGVGGYASGPVVLAAWLMRIPTAVQEQNAHRRASPTGCSGGSCRRPSPPSPRRRATSRAGKVLPARQPHPPHAAWRTTCGRSSKHPSRCACSSSAARRARTRLNMRVIEALPHLADLRERAAHRAPDRRARPRAGGEGLRGPCGFDAGRARVHRRHERRLRARRTSSSAAPAPPRSPS